MTLLTASCVHCGQPIVERVDAIALAEMGRLRDHLLGCPSALSACAPALPVFERPEQVMRHVRVDGGEG